MLRVGERQGLGVEDVGVEETGETTGLERVAAPGEDPGVERYIGLAEMGALERCAVVEARSRRGRERVKQPARERCAGRRDGNADENAIHGTIVARTQRSPCSAPAAQMRYVRFGLE